MQGECKREDKTWIHYREGNELISSHTLILRSFGHEIKISHLNKKRVLRFNLYEQRGRKMLRNHISGWALGPEPSGGWAGCTAQTSPGTVSPDWDSHKRRIFFWSNGGSAAAPFQDSADPSDPSWLPGKHLFRQLPGRQVMKLSSGWESLHQLWESFSRVQTMHRECSCGVIQHLWW